MAKKLIKVASAYDFDGTLTPGNMQEHAFTLIKYMLKLNSRNI